NWPVRNTKPSDSVAWLLGETDFGRPSMMWNLMPDMPVSLAPRAGRRNACSMSEQLDWRRMALVRGLKVTDLAQTVATSIDGIDLGDDLDAETVAIIRAACVERTLLLFRGQEKLSPAAYLAFARRFGGTPDLHSLRHYCLPDHHEIFVVGNVHEKQAT